MVRIVPVNLHWLARTEPTKDLCAHAGIQLIADERILLDASDEELAVSTGALHLLRTLEADHSAATPIAEHLIPHCGHFMSIDEKTGQVENMGCNLGVNWWVTTRDGQVELALETQRARVGQEEWTDAICQFGDAVNAFYLASEAKTPDDDYDLKWFTSFRAEWNARRASARGAT